jgi:uncharacterized membrane protein SpoIIM required for sporulation
MSAPAFTLKSAQFRREREEAWRELEMLLERVESKGLRDLTATELNRLPVLYRGAASSLSVATAISLDKNLLDYLTALVGRAYVSIYGARRRPQDAVAEFFRHDFPAVVRRYAGFIALSLGLVALGVLAGYRMTATDPERYYSFVDDDRAEGRNPAASTKELRDVLYSGGEGHHLSVFAAFLFTHNSKVGMLCFALGFAAGVPVVFLLLYTGLELGAMAALYASRGLGPEFCAWILPHGVTEIGALCLCGAAGMVLGRALVFPGRHTRLRNLALQGREVALLAVGSVVMFLIAGGIEGFFRQLVQNVTVRWSLAAVTLVFWAWYFLTVGRSRERDLAR